MKAELKPEELRLGNWVKIEGSEPFQITGIFKEWIWALIQETDFPVKDLQGIELSEEWLKKAGFESLPHFTITNSLILNIGRNRIISVGNVGTPNEMIWLCEINATDPTKIDDLVCMRNFDYDGKTYLHMIQNLVHALTGNELIFNHG